MKLFLQAPVFFSALAFLLPSRGAEIVVAPSGGDYSGIQDALNAAQPGDTVTVRAGAYAEALSFPRSGSEAAGFITLRAAPGETVTLDPNADTDAVSIGGRSWIKVHGLEITNSRAVSDAAGIRVQGGGDRLEIRSNRIYGLTGTDAVGIMILGNSSTPISRVVVAENLIHDCAPSPSEALALNGNVVGFEVTGNTVRDVNNIGIDFIGGESWTGNYGVAREGICRGNRVLRARSDYGGGYAAGIYVDGGRDIIVEGNSVRECDLGIEVGAENPGYDATGVIVRNNIAAGNQKAGIVFGGYEESRGRVVGCEFSGNTLYQNDTLGDGNGEFSVNWAENNRVRNNLVWAGAQNLLVTAAAGSVGNAFDSNLYFAPGGAAEVVFIWGGASYNGFENYRAATGQDADSLFAAPFLAGPDADDFRLVKGSPAIDAGDTSSSDLLGEFDYYGNARVRGGAVDIGAAEFRSPGAAASGDYDGDGTSDIAVFRPSSGFWLIRGLTMVCFGSAPDLVVPRDYSGDGIWDVAIYRPSLGKWMVRGLTNVFYGVSTDIPVSGDYNGDGSTDIAVFRPFPGKWLVKDGAQVFYGNAADTVVPGDYTGNGTWDYAVWRSSTGRWLVKDGPNAYWGATADTAQPGDYNGDGTLDFAVFRSSAGRWLVRGVTNAYYGVSTDRPVTNP